MSEEALTRYKHIYVIDTSAAVHNPGIYRRCADKDNAVIIPSGHIDELDSLKERDGLRGHSARIASRYLKEYRRCGKLQKRFLKQGVQIEGGGWIFLDSPDYQSDVAKKLPINAEESVDNQIICIAKQWQAKDCGPVTIISQDTQLLLKADMCEVDAEEVDLDISIALLEDLYTGMIDIAIDDKGYDFISTLKQLNTIVSAEEVFRIIGPLTLYPTQCCRCKTPDGKVHALALYKRHRSGLNTSEPIFQSVKRHAKKGGQSGFAPADDEQDFAFALLTDQDISVVTMEGSAGTGKTIVSLFAGCAQIKDGIFEQMIIYLPIAEVGGKSLGYYPGDLREKLEPWTAKIHDNLRYLQMFMGRKSEGRSGHPENFIDVLQRNNQITMEPLIHVRGRSIHNALICVEEMQNLPPGAAMTMVTRKSWGSKIVLSGDPTQRDNEMLTELSNGLVYTIETLKGQDFYGHIKLRHTHRPPDVQVMAELMNKR